MTTVVIGLSCLLVLSSHVVLAYFVGKLFVHMKDEGTRLQKLAADIVATSYIYQNAETPMEAVQVAAQKDVATEAVKDAYAKAKQKDEDDERESQPVMMNTVDGEQIDMRDFEVM